jgi:hypothetical protein
MMVLELGLFFFVLLGSKLVLGLIAVYMLLPGDAVCATCDAETLPLEHPRGTRRLVGLLRLQRRWCMECRRESLTRCPRPTKRHGRRAVGPSSRAADPVAERSRRP